MAGTSFIVPVTAQATLTVTSNADAGGICPGPDCTLRQAILTALPGETIDFASGITAINLTSAELLITKDVTISGPGAGVLTIQRSAANGTPTFRIFNIASGNVVLSGLTIANGDAHPGGAGGGIFNGSGSVTVDSCVITQNNGGASDNSGCGGGIFNSSNGTVNVTNSTLSHNFAGSYGNTATCGGGGAIWNSSGGTVNATNSTISNNAGGSFNGSSSGGGGGGIRNNGGTVTLLNSTVSDNSGGGEAAGGGIWNSSGGTVTLTNCTVSTNNGIGWTSSAGGPGGIYNDKSTLTVTSSTITKNFGQGSSGISNPSGVVNVRNTIIAGNTRPDCRYATCIGPADFGGQLTSQGYVLIGNTTGITSITGDTTGNQLNVDPMLGPLQNNGGPTLTHALLSNSPAIDAGHSSGSNTDQRGLPRPIDFSFKPNATGGDGADIGPFEVQTLPAPTPTPTPSPTPTPTATPTATPPPPATLVNLSTRARVLTGDRVLIGGFIITGTDLKKVLIRGMGPSFVGVGATLSNPTLELHQGNTTIATNDDWKMRPEGTSQQAEIEGTGIPPKNDFESAILAMLGPQMYTTVLAGKNGGTGVGLVEIYDLDQAANARLANLSSRGFVDTDDNVMIGGFIVAGQSGSGPARVIIRALGPSVPVAGALADPTLALYDGNGTQIGSNNDWRSDQEAEIQATTIPPPNDAEAAIVRDFAPGNYTAIMRGAQNTTGIGLVEIYYLR